MTKNWHWGILPPSYPLLSPAGIGGCSLSWILSPRPNQATATAVPLSISINTKPLHTLHNGWNFQGPGLSHLSAPLPLLSEFSQTLGAQRPSVRSRSSGCACQNTYVSAVCISRPLLAIFRKGEMPGSGKQALGAKVLGCRRTRFSGPMISLS